MSVSLTCTIAQGHEFCEIIAIDLSCFSENSELFVCNIAPGDISFPSLSLSLSIPRDDWWNVTESKPLIGQINFDWRVYETRLTYKRYITGLILSWPKSRQGWRIRKKLTKVVVLHAFRQYYIKTCCDNRTASGNSLPQ